LAQPGRQVQTQDKKPERRALEAYLADPRVVDGIKTVAGRYLQPDRMLRIVTYALRKTPKLAACDPQSFLGAVMTSAALGLEPNTPQGHAYLIPYDKRGKLDSGKWGVVGTECQFVIGYRGFIELAYRNHNIVKFVAKAVHENDEFDHCEGSDSFLRFKPALKNRGDLIGAFAYAKYRTANGGEAEMSVVLPLEEIHKARAKSETWNALLRAVDNADDDRKRAAAEKKLAETPWVMWEDDMAAKTALRKLAKVIPVGDAFAAAAALDERAEAGTVNLAEMADPATARHVIEGEVEPPDVEEEEESEADAGPEKPKRATKAKAPQQPAPSAPGPDDHAASQADEPTFEPPPNDDGGMADLVPEL
jgi:recombination protein RecT